ncbi:MAG: Cellulophaga phage phi4:1 [Bacteroidota bacterium]|jgi:hypothetical protein
MKEFPNGFTSWQETHYEVVAAITNELADDHYSEFRDDLVHKILRENGHGGLYELAEDLTDEFELLNKGREWDGEFFEEIERFLDEKFR